MVVDYSNTTFRRNFPDITADLARPAPGPDGPDPAAGAGRLARLQHQNAELRAANHQLSEHLELAIANIQRLTLDNHHLRHQLEAAINVTRLDPHQRPRSNRPH